MKNNINGENKAMKKAIIIIMAIGLFYGYISMESLKTVDKIQTRNNSVYSQLDN